MSSQNWRYALIAGSVSFLLIAAILSGFLLYRGNNYKSEAELASQFHAGHAVDSIQESCVSLPLQSQAECLSKAISAHRENYRDEYDLYAQRNMALWTTAIGVVGVMSLPLTAIGVVFVFMTLRETRRVGEAQVSAYVSIESVKVTVPTVEELAHLVHTEHKLPFTFEVEFRNSGASPAKELQWKIWAGVMCSNDKKGWITDIKMNETEPEIWLTKAETVNPGPPILKTEQFDFIAQASDISEAVTDIENSRLQIFAQITAYFENIFDDDIIETYSFDCDIDLKKLGSAQSMRGIPSRDFELIVWAPTIIGELFEKQNDKDAN